MRVVDQYFSILGSVHMPWPLAYLQTPSFPLLLERTYSVMHIYLFLRSHTSFATKTSTGRLSGGANKRETCKSIVLLLPPLYEDISFPVCQPIIPLTIVPVPLPLLLPLPLAPPLPRSLPLPLPRPRPLPHPRPLILFLPLPVSLTSDSLSLPAPTTSGPATVRASIGGEQRDVGIFIIIIMQFTNQEYHFGLLVPFAQI